MKPPPPMPEASVQAPQGESGGDRGVDRVTSLFENIDANLRSLGLGGGYYAVGPLGASPVQVHRGLRESQR
jgi:hypothetical protein